MRTLKPETKENIEDSTGRTLEEIRQTPSDLIDEANELRAQYQSLPVFRFTDHIISRIRCREYRKYLQRIANRRFAKYTRCLNQAIYFYRHQRKICECYDKPKAR